MSKNKIFAVCMTCMISLWGYAQKGANNPQKILDKMAAALKQAEPIKATFLAKVFTGNKAQRGTQGILCYKGGMYFVETSSIKIWFDGKTQWSYSSTNEEVNITTPTQSEQQAINPYVFLSLPKKGYKLTLSETSLRGRKCHEIHMLATTTKAGIPELILSIDATSYLPLCIRMRQGSQNWTMFSVMSVQTRQKVSDAAFRFQPEAYPDAEIIDLR